MFGEKSILIETKENECYAKTVFIFFSISNEELGTLISDKIYKEIYSRMKYIL
jgi:hypothetical protein